MGSLSKSRRTRDDPLKETTSDTVMKQSVYHVTYIVLRKKIKENIYRNYFAIIMFYRNHIRKVQPAAISYPAIA